MAGFTLLELIVVVAIFTIVVGAGYLLLSSEITGWHSADARIELQMNLRRAMGAILSELSESVFTKVDIGAGGDTITFQTPVDVDGGQRRRFQWKWIDLDSDGESDFYLEDTFDSSGDVRWGSYLRGEDHTLASSDREGRWVRFILEGDELKRRVLNSSQTATVEDFLLADDIERVGFRRVSNDVIAIDLEARKLTAERHPITYSLSTELHLRSSI